MGVDRLGEKQFGSMTWQSNRKEKEQSYEGGSFGLNLVGVGAKNQIAFKEGIVNIQKWKVNLALN